MNKYKLPTINCAVQTVILANGEFPSHPIPLAILNNAEYIVCCDGAINELATKNIIPNAIVGDCDSLTPDNRIKFANILFPNYDQETNDLTKAVQFCITQGRNSITILAATGKREDHSLGNISLLYEYIDIADVQMITDYGVFTPINSDSKFESCDKQQVSLFSKNQSEEISCYNLKYPVNKRSFSNWWEGTLNQSLGDSFTIETNSKMLVFRLFYK